MKTIDSKVDFTIETFQSFYRDYTIIYGNYLSITDIK